MPTLDELRQDAISKIEQAFPKKQPPKRVTKAAGDRYMRKELMDYFSDQRWDKLVDDEHIVYRMSESDYLEAISDDAYCYYFPAFLLTTFKQTHQPFSLSKAVELLAKFSRAQLEAFLAFLEYFIVSEREYHEQRQSWTQRPIDDPMLENWEDVQLRIMVRLDDLKDS